MSDWWEAFTMFVVVIFLSAIMVGIILSIAQVAYLATHSTAVGIIVGIIATCAVGATVITITEKKR